jgi:hypothetical protein
MAEEGVEGTSLSERVLKGQKKRMEEDRVKAREIIARSPTGLDRVVEEQVKKETGIDVRETSSEPEPK